MTGVSASAPGKIVLCGEYAVLFGAPAIVTAVDRRATVEVETVSGAESVVVAPGMSNEQVRFHRGAPGIYQWSTGRYRLVEEVIEALGVTAIPALACRLDTQAFRDPVSGKKLGLGSSAALATALTAALDALLELQSDVHSVAASAHWAYQSGTGSGVDIAAGFAGGTLRFEKRDAPVVRALDWPAGLQYRVLWSGHPANTTQKLRRLVGRRAAAEPSGTALATAASRVADLWEDASSEALLAGLGDYVANLECFSKDHDLGVFDAGHGNLLEPARSLGLVYKPCGAGGGDIGVVFGSDDDALGAFCELAEGSGFIPMDISVAARGVTVDCRDCERRPQRHNS